MKKTKEKKKRLDRWLFMFCMILFFGTISFGLLHQYREYNRLKEEKIEVLAQIQQEKEKKIEYENNKDYYKSDAYIEKVAREQLGFIKPNEVLFINRQK